ncbi:hypothetical protein O181_082845 [Austropuccinia psidii MF-1]|uniref:Uncharacterized protein n=1 Tax=Austropuccinia psidii MF-1 TaxID=1389203 RepID=A0A9Q3IL76_9BASI|nr:hypothetical protein [Austropuccinia psidii MF-1]
MAFLGHLGPLQLLRSTVRRTIRPLLAKSNEAKRGQPPSPQGQVGPKPQLDPPEPKLVTNLLDPKLAQRPSGHQFCHKSRKTHFWPWITMDQYLTHGLWQPPEATRSAQAFS